jgi:hypothetical protein
MKFHLIQMRIRLDLIVSGNLEEQLLTSKFILKLLKEKVVSFSIGKIELKDKIDYQNFIDQLSQRYSKLKEIDALLSLFSIEPKQLYLDQVTNQQNGILKLLIDSLVYKKRIRSLPFPEENKGILRIPIGNLILGVIILKDNKGNYLIHAIYLIEILG